MLLYVFKGRNVFSSCFLNFVPTTTNCYLLSTCPTLQVKNRKDYSYSIKNLVELSIILMQTLRSDQEASIQGKVLIDNLTDDLR